MTTRPWGVQPSSMPGIQMRGVTACALGYPAASCFTCSGFWPVSSCEEAASGRREIQVAATAKRFDFIAPLSPKRGAKNVMRCRRTATVLLALRCLRSRRVALPFAPFRVARHQAEPDMRHRVVGVVAASSARAIREAVVDVAKE